MRGRRLVLLDSREFHAVQVLRVQGLRDVSTGAVHGVQDVKLPAVLPHKLSAAHWASWHSAVPQLLPALQCELRLQRPGANL